MNCGYEVWTESQSVPALQLSPLFQDRQVHPLGREKTIKNLSKYSFILTYLKIILKCYKILQNLEFLQEKKSNSSI